MQHSNTQIKIPTLAQALSPIIVMLLLLGLGYALFDLPPEPLMVLSCVFAGFLVKYLGFSYNDILKGKLLKLCRHY